MIRTGVMLSLAMLLIGNWATQADPAAESDLSGYYECAGLNGDGSKYNGVVIIAKHGDTYRVQWVFESRLGAAGIGIRDGDTLAVSYFGGLVMYKIDDQMRLVGRWTVPDANGVLSSETLTRMKEQPEARPERRQRAPATPAPGIRL